MNSEKPSLPPVAVPPGVRWREFRIQLLPPLAVGAAFVLAGVLWYRTVVPVEPPLPPPPSKVGQELDPDPPARNPEVDQGSRGETNAIVRSPATRDYSNSFQR